LLFLKRCCVTLSCCARTARLSTRVRIAACVQWMLLSQMRRHLKPKTDIFRSLSNFWHFQVGLQRSQSTLLSNGESHLLPNKPRPDALRRGSKLPKVNASASTGCRRREPTAGEMRTHVLATALKLRTGVHCEGIPAPRVTSAGAHCNGIPIRRGMNLREKRVCGTFNGCTAQEG
jgi:hypothetical protein